MPLNKKTTTKITIFFFLGGLIIIFICLFYFMPSSKNVIKDIEEMFAVYKENEFLKEKLANSKYLSSEIDSLNNENKELKDIVDMNNYINEQLKYETEIGTVIKREDNKWSDKLVVFSKKKYSSGIVMTSKGIIGRVRESKDNKEDNINIVQLITKEPNNISTVVEDNENIGGIIKGYDKERGLLEMEYMRNDKEKEIIGDNIISSGKGGVYPYGLIIGKVKEVEFSKDGLNKIALIEPSANFNEINNVIIIPN